MINRYLVVFSIFVFNTSLISKEIQYRFDYQIGYTDQNKFYSTLRGEIFNYKQFSLGLMMEHNKEEYKTDSGFFFKFIPFKSGLELLLDVGSSYIDKSSDSAIGITSLYMFQITENTFGIGVNYKDYGKSKSQTSLFLNLRF